MHKDAVISECGTYRYRLTRKWGDGGQRCTFIMLNPSTADASVDDNTIRKCIKYAKREGCDELEVMNLFAFRATDPKELLRNESRGVDVRGPSNDAYFGALVCDPPKLIIAGWGATKGTAIQAHRVNAILSHLPVYCLAKTKAGHPGHPLYLKDDAPLLPLNLAANEAADGEGE